MKPVKSKFIEIRKALDPLHIMVVHKNPGDPGKSTMHLSPDEEPDSQESQIIVIKKDGFSIISIETIFSLVRDEINSNMSKPIELSDKQSYLKEIFNFYSELEERIVEDEFGKLSTDIDKLVKNNLNLDLYEDEYEEFLKNLKYNLRSEIQFVYDQIQHLSKDSNNIPSTNQSSDSGIKWRKHKIDLIELIIALHETESIFNDNKPMNQIDMISVFSDIFRFDLSDYENDLSQAKIKRKKGKAPFLNKLKIAFENYCLKEG